MTTVARSRYGENCGFSGLAADSDGATLKF